MQEGLAAGSSLAMLYAFCLACLAMLSDGCKAAGLGTIAPVVVLEFFHALRRTWRAGVVHKADLITEQEVLSQGRECEILMSVLCVHGACQAWLCQL